MESGREVDRRYSLRSRSICVTLPQFPTLQRPHVFNPARISRRLPGTKELSCSSSGHSLTSSVNGERALTDGSKLSSISFPTGRTETTSTVNFSHQVTPQIGDLSVQVQQTILARIRRCGRLGDEREARRLYLVNGVGFREYRQAYKAGQREYWKSRAMQKEKELA